MNKLVLCGSMATAALALASCGLTAGLSTTGTTVAADTSSALDSGVKVLTQADNMATLYAELPSCGGTVVICSNPATVTKIKQDAAQARLDLEAAQAGSLAVQTALNAVSLVGQDMAALSTGK